MKRCLTCNTPMDGHHYRCFVCRRVGDAIREELPDELKAQPFIDRLTSAAMNARAA